MVGALLDKQVFDALQLRTTVEKCNTLLELKKAPLLFELVHFKAEARLPTRTPSSTESKQDPDRLGQKYPFESL